MKDTPIDQVAIAQANGRTAWSFRTIARRLAISLGLLVAAIGVLVFAYHYWTVGRFLQETDDAYVKADYSTIAPKVSGYIAEVAVTDNEHVVAGQLLARIHDRDYGAALDHAAADAAAAAANVSNLDAQRQQQTSVVLERQASVTASIAALKLARDDDARYRALILKGAVDKRGAEQAATVLDQSRANLKRDEAALVTAQKQIVVLTTARVRAEAQRRASAAALEQARLNVSYTRILAPLDGTVGARSVRIGQYVQAGTQLMAVVPLHAVYVVANYKETQLTHMQQGQSVTIRADAFPDREFRGRVDSISPASGLEFSLLPPDNATGNFTKVVQRIPVRIVFDADVPPGVLRSGMSVEPTVDTRASRPGKQMLTQVAQYDRGSTPHE